MKVTQDWIEKLTFKQQTVLLLALRGCDGILKDDLSKKFVRKYRSVILKDAGGGQFMEDDISGDDIYNFLKSLDHYPMHWLFHFLHAIQIVGYMHPEKEVWHFWTDLYCDIVEALHLEPELHESMQERLQDGRSSSCWKS